MARAAAAAANTAPKPDRPSYYAKDAVKERQRVKDLERWGRFYWGRGKIERTADTKRFWMVVLHHYAHYAERYVLGEEFLASWTDFSAAERAAAMNAEFKVLRRYGAEELAALFGITMPVRYRLGITTIGAIDFPPDARNKLQSLKKNAQRCQKRRSNAQPSRPKRNQSRRLTAIIAVLPEDGTPLSISEICKRLVDTKAFGFRTTSPKSLPKTIRRLVDTDAGDHLVVDAQRKGTVVSRRLDRAPAAANSARPPAAPSSPAVTPTDAIEYERWFFSELDRFTPETAVNLPRWFLENNAVAIRTACKVSTLEKQFMAVAKRRHQELTGKV